jgi:hypothetical protein
MSVEDWCQLEQVADAIRDALAAHGFNSSAALRWLSQQDVVKLGLQPGHVRELQKAIEKWAGSA